MLRWLWTSRRVDARLARLALLPLSGLWKLAVTVRNHRYDRGRAPVQDLPLPSVGVGNLSVGGSGKTPVTGWIAGHFAGRGLVPGIVTSGAGKDEAVLLAQRVPAARVIADSDRVRAAGRLRDQGADLVILDDAYQLRRVKRDFNLAVVSAESSRAVPWALPAGPWREGWGALERADAMMITRKRASVETARAALERLRPLIRTGGAGGIVHLATSRYERLQSGELIRAGELAGRKVVVASAIADPEAFVSQIKATGALVQVASWPDHHQFQDADLAWLARAARKADFLVVTQKDAVKLRGRWPAQVPEPLVAVLDLVWEAGEAEIIAALDRIPRKAAP